MAGYQSNPSSLRASLALTASWWAGTVAPMVLPQSQRPRSAAVRGWMSVGCWRRWLSARVRRSQGLVAVLGPLLQLDPDEVALLLVHRGVGAVAKGESRQESQQRGSKVSEFLDFLLVREAVCCFLEGLSLTEEEEASSSQTAKTGCTFLLDLNWSFLLLKLFLSHWATSLSLFSLVWPD